MAEWDSVEERAQPLRAVAELHSRIGALGILVCAEYKGNGAVAPPFLGQRGRWPSIFRATRPLPLHAYVASRLMMFVLEVAI